MFKMRFAQFICLFVYLKGSPLADAETTASLPGVQTIHTKPNNYNHNYSQIYHM